MAIKKNELYSSLWASCDKLRGGMDASQYKDYILTLLFVKYVTDKFQGVKYADITVPEGGSFDDLVALKGNKNIGEEMDKVIAKLAEAGENNLRGVIDNAHFNDEAKLGSGKEMVDKLTGLIAIFQRDEFNFKKNKASGDDILGDAYEYLMRHFATESGKSKGQFYTPAEVSRILAKVAQNDTVDIKNSRDDRFWGMEDQRGEMDAMLRGGINGQPRYTEEDYVRELSRYIASPEVESPDMFSFHIPTLHAKESKWLSNMIILRPLKETIQLSYSIKSSSSNGDLAGTLELTV